jgi:exosortase
MRRPVLPRPWTVRHIAGGAALALLGVLATWQAWVDIVTFALRDEEASHILLVPLVVAWLAWVRRGRLRQAPPAWQWGGPAAVLLGWVAYNVGDTNLWQSVWHLGAILIVVGCALTVWGLPLLWKMLPAFAALLFLIPIPNRVRQQIAIPLQTASAQVTQHVFEFCGLDIDRSGNVLSVNGTDVAIAEACNGLRMTFALVLVSYAFAFGNPLRNYVRLTVVALSPLSAILCNVIRLVPTVWIYGRFSERVGDQFHAVSGWVMLFVAFLILMGVMRLLRWALFPVSRYTLAYD